MAKRNMPTKQNVEELETTVEQVTNEELAVNEIVKELEPITGVVANCAKVNVRKRPSANAKVEKIIDAGTTVVIEEDRSTKDFYAVIADGIKGFCMKQYIEVKS